MIPLIEKNRGAVEQLCRRYRVRRLDLFGSATTPDEFNPATSDLDFIVEFSDTSAGLARRFLGLAEALEALFARKVDVITERSIRNPIFRQSVSASRERIYEETSERANS